MDPAKKPAPSEIAIQLNKNTFETIKAEVFKFRSPFTAAVMTLSTSSFLA